MKDFKIGETVYIKEYYKIIEIYTEDNAMVLKDDDGYTTYIDINSVFKS